MLLRISEFEKVRRQKPKVRSEDDEGKARGTDFRKSLREAELGGPESSPPMQRIAQGLQICVWDSKSGIFWSRGERRKAGAGGQAAAPLGVQISRPRPNTPLTPFVKSELLAARLTPLVPLCVPGAQ